MGRLPGREVSALERDVYLGGKPKVSTPLDPKAHPSCEQNDRQV